MSPDVASVWRQTALEARQLVVEGRDAYAPVDQLSRLYRRLGDDERVVVNELIAADLGSSDSGVRYDALWLVREFRIVAASPALASLAARLTASAEVSATFELEKVERLRRELGSA